MAIPLRILHVLKKGNSKISQILQYFHHISALQFGCHGNFIFIQIQR